MQSYNPYIIPFMSIVDRDNGLGYQDNLPKNGNLISVPNSRTKLFYELKNIESTTVIFIRYVHYDNIKQLYTLLAFACQWWANLKPGMIYMREKERGNEVGKYLMKLGFRRNRIKNELLPFDCKNDGKPCHCKVFEYVAYNLK